MKELGVQVMDGVFVKASVVDNLHNRERLQEQKRLHTVGRVLYRLMIRPKLEIVEVSKRAR